VLEGEANRNEVYVVAGFNGHAEPVKKTQTPRR
jgi:hypothetical protein